MKVHRIIAIIEVENDNSITSVEVTKLYPTNADIPFAITNITTNGNADNIQQIYDVISERRLAISTKLKGIASYIDKSLDDYKNGIFGRDENTNETNDDLLL